ncbi:MAG TPA: hypothetical protein VFS43_29495 [Polyangiaceae bacterium]|nr:hypothetical protein [Polyangiaceae bacterium]
MSGSGGGRVEKFVLPGDNANATCKSSGKSAFATYGTLFSVMSKIIVEETFNELEAGADVPNKLGTSFALLDTPGHLTGAQLIQSLANFLTAAYGGDPAAYTGESMLKSHTGLGITKTQYDYFVANVIVDVNTKAGIPSDDISSCFAPVLGDAKLVNDIVELPNQ